MSTFRTRTAGKGVRIGGTPESEPACEALEPREFLSVDINVLRVIPNALSIGPGQNLGVRIVLRNDGSEATRPFTAQGRISRDKVWGNADDVVIETSQITDRLEADGKEYETGGDSPIPVLPAGRYRVALRFDTGHQTGDRNYANNTRFSRLFTVRAEYVLEFRGKGHAIRGDELPSTRMGTEFGTVNAGGGSAVRTYIIENKGNIPFLFSDPAQVSISPSRHFDPHDAGSEDFEIITAPTGPLEAGQRAKIRVRFDPSGRGEHHAALQISDSDRMPLFGVELKGRAVAPAVQLDAIGGSPIQSGAYFAPAGWGSTVLEQQFRITNTGDAALRIGEITFAQGAVADYEVTVLPASSLAAGASSVFTVHLRHATVEPSVRLVITTNAPFQQQLGLWILPS